MINHIQADLYRPTAFLRFTTIKMAAITSEPQSTQYNEIADDYAALYPPNGQPPANFSLAAIETSNMERIVKDPRFSTRGKRILELACGNGYYAVQHLEWGAASVTGIDISSGMLEVARQYAASNDIPETKLRYVLGDVTDENLTIEGGPFDVVTGCWLLNYAPDTATMTKMWRFIGRNLIPGGTWIGMTVPPLLTNQPFEGTLIDSLFQPDGAWGRHGETGKMLATMPNGDGLKVHIVLSAPDSSTLR